MVAYKVQWQKTPVPYRQTPLYLKKTRVFQLFHFRGSKMKQKEEMKQMAVKS